MVNRIINFKRFSIASSSADDTNDTNVLISEIYELENILTNAAVTKTTESDIVINTLLELEKKSRKLKKLDPKNIENMKLNLKGDWQLIFTTGTIDTQKKLGKVNYFPLKAVQTFDPSTNYIQNTVWAFGNPIIKFMGEFVFLTSEKSGLTKLEFDFDKLCLFEALFGGININLSEGEAANLGAKSGLGSQNNIKLSKKKKKPFFNWISANNEIATARGGGGGLALWKRI